MRAGKLLSIVLSFVVVFSPAVSLAAGSFPSNWKDMTPIQQTEWLNTKNNVILPPYTSNLTPTTPSFWSQLTNNAPCEGYGCTLQNYLYGPSTTGVPSPSSIPTGPVTSPSAYMDKATKDYGPGTTGSGAPDSGGGASSGAAAIAGPVASGGIAVGTAVAGGMIAGEIMSSTVANGMCAMWDVRCPCGNIWVVASPTSPAGCKPTVPLNPAANPNMCPPGTCFDASVSSVKVLGICVAKNVCQGVSLPGIGGGSTMLSSLGIGLALQATGAVLGKLVSGIGGGAGAGGGASPYGANPYGSNPYGPSLPTAQGCATYTPVSDAALLSRPCTYYVPGAPTGSGTGTATGTTAGGGCTPLDQYLGSCTGSGTGTTGSGTGTATGTGTGTATGGGGTATSTTNASISATPTSGPAPLNVTFTLTDTSTGCARDAVVITYGDSSAGATVFPATSACGTRAPVTLTHMYSAAGSFVARLRTALSGSELSSVTISATASGGPAVDVTTGALAANPSSGNAPLSVSIIASDTSSVCPHEPVALVYGDTTSAIPVFDGTTSCGGAAQQFTHTYTAAGSYRLALVKADATVVRSLTINVAPRSASTGTGGSQIPTGAMTSIDDPNVSSLTPGTQTPGAQTSTGQTTTAPAAAGPTGDIKLFGTGATVVASTRDPQTNSTVAGFFGASTFGTNDKGVAARLCESRPWSTNFLSYVIPPSFFDSLCSVRGYQVGPVTQIPAATPTQTQTQVQLTQQPVKTTPKPTPAPVVKPATKPVVQTPSVPAKIDIWAVPASAPLGSRVTIFWNADGVESCTETSPDGSFSHNTLKGGGNTVPITAATTFTMSCLLADGSHVTDFVTVKIAI